MKLQVINGQYLNYVKTREADRLPKLHSTTKLLRIYLSTYKKEKLGITYEYINGEEQTEGEVTPYMKSEFGK